MTYIVQKRVSFIGNRATNAFHAELFHGGAKRGNDGLFFPNYKIGDDGPFLGLDIVRSSYFSPRITAPSLNWIVNNSIKSVLSDYPNIEFLRCASVSTYPLDPLNLEDFTEGFKHPMRPMEIHDYAVERLGKNECNEEFWEVIVNDGNQLDRTVDVKQINWMIHEDGEAVELQVASEALNQHPLFYHEGAILVADNLFNEISSDLSETYFFVDHV